MFDNDTENLFVGLIDLIKKWKPPIYPNEKEYQKDFYEYLTNLQDKGKLKKDRKILRERGANRIDLLVDGVGIELKMNIKHQPEVDRATAQIKRMLKEFDCIILVLVGNNNSRQHVTLLKDEIKDFQSNGDMLGGGGKKIKIIEIGKDTDKEENNKDNSNFGFTIPKIELPKSETPKFDNKTMDFKF